QQRDGRGSGGMAHHLERARRPVGEPHAVDVDVDDLARVLALAVLAPGASVIAHDGLTGSPSPSYIVVGPNCSASRDARTAERSPTTASCIASGCRCCSAARCTSAAVTPRTRSRYTSK